MIKISTVKENVRQAQTLQRILKSICNKEKLLREHVTFVNASGRGEQNNIKQDQIASVNLEEEQYQVTIPVVDITMLALDFTTEFKGKKCTVREVLRGEAGLISIENGP